MFGRFVSLFALLSLVGCVSVSSQKEVQVDGTVARCKTTNVRVLIYRSHTHTCDDGAVAATTEEKKPTEQ